MAEKAPISSDAELTAIMLTHGQPVENQVRSWVSAIPAPERVEKLTKAYLSVREREERLEAVAVAARAYRDERTKDDWGTDEVLLARQMECRQAMYRALDAVADLLEED